MSETGSAHATADVAGIVTRSKSSFTWPMRLLPAAKRQGLFTLYAFARKLDDIADGDAPTARKLADLQLWREEIDRIADQRPCLQPLARAMAETCARFKLPRAPFDALLDGMESDASGPRSAPSRSGFERYCYQVAGSVGEQCVRIFGRDDGPALRFAREVGSALQTTNILRDIDEDARQGRVYVPRDLLDALAMPHDAAGISDHPQRAALAARLGAVARTHFANARACLREAGPEGLFTARQIMAVYEVRLERMARSGYAKGVDGRPGPLGLLRALLRPTWSL
ncbi:MAG: squalene/phytoene synthase family protein [Geminicoccaceae bacterium]